MSDILIRKFKEEDKAFIMSTWLRSYKHNSFFTKKLTNTVYYKYHHDIINRILARADILIACDTQSPETIFGYAVFEEPGIVHYAYVKKAFRGMGIFSKLIEPLKGLDIIFTHYTDHCNKLVENANLKLTYIPYLVA